MVNQVWGRHTVHATGTNDSGKQVSVNAWNNNLNRKGLLGFDADTIASASSITIPAFTTTVGDQPSSFIKLSGTTSIDTIVTTNTSEGDLLYVITTGSVTLNNTSSPSSAGDIRLLSDANKDLSTTVPTILMRISDYWYEYGGGITNALNDIGNVVITSVENEDVLAWDSTTSKWINQSADETGRVTADSTTTFTNKTIDQDGTGNSITNIADASIKASAGIAYSKLTLTGAVTSNDLAGSIANGKLATDPLNYANMTAPAADVAFNSKKLTGVADPTAAQDAATKNYVDTNVSSVTASSTTTFSNKSIDLTDNTLTGTSLELKTAISDETGSGSLVFATSPTLVTPVLGTPASGTLTNATGLPIATGLATGTSANLASVISDETGSGALVFATSPTLVTPALGTPASGVATNLTGTASGLTAGNVTTNANLTGDVTSVGNAATIAGDKITEAMLKSDNGPTNDYVLTAKSSAAGGITWAAAASGSDTPWTEVHDFDTYYYDMQVQTKPADPGADNARFYIKEIDSNNDGLFCLLRKNSAFVETQIV